MSTEFLEDIDVDVNGSTVLLSVKKSGDAFLTVMGKEDLSTALNANDYHLSPDENGWRNAEKIVAAINAWVKHTQSKR